MRRAYGWAESVSSAAPGASIGGAAGTARQSTDVSRTSNLCLALAATAAVLLAAACGGNTASAPAVRPAPAHSAAPAQDRLEARAKTPAPSPSASASALAVDPGTLPQTRTLPGDQDAQFQAGAHALWEAIVQDRPELARPFFFPLSAYQQVKAIWNPADDYQNRLLTWYALDIEAAHAHLGADAASAKFVGVQVPEGNAEWIEPGVEYNKGSYYRVYGTRLDYRINGRDASIGVFSLISWRGEWYVVHLGPSTRDATEGIVYDPSS